MLAQPTLGAYLYGHELMFIASSLDLRAYPTALNPLDAPVWLN